jgi:hypothetical protein
MNGGGVEVPIPACLLEVLTVHIDLDDSADANNISSRDVVHCFSLSRL